MNNAQLVRNRYSIATLTIMKIKQLCANERCDNLVPAQIGPKLCPKCQSAGHKLPGKVTYPQGHEQHHALGHYHDNLKGKQ